MSHSKILYLSFATLGLVAACSDLPAYDGISTTDAAPGAPRNLDDKRVSDLSTDEARTVCHEMRMLLPRHEITCDEGTFSIGFSQSYCDGPDPLVVGNTCPVTVAELRQCVRAAVVFDFCDGVEPAACVTWNDCE